MARYVLTKQRFTADAAAAGATWTPDQIRQLPHVRVLDQTGDRIMLIEVDPKALDGHELPAHGWKVVREVVYSAPWEMDPPF
jgi:hypothetical protein